MTKQPRPPRTARAARLRRFNKVRSAVVSRRAKVTVKKTPGGLVATNKTRGGMVAKATMTGRRPIRIRRAPFSSDLNNTLRYIAAPVFKPHPSHAHAGGKHSWAICGPRAYKTSGKSDAVSSKPRAIAEARKKYPSAGFKAGHLLNAVFGGPGYDSKNLTILTARANVNHGRFDEPLKRAFYYLEKAYKAMHGAGINIRSCQLGISISVAVSPTAWGTVYPDTCIFRELKCCAKLYVGPTPLTSRDLGGEWGDFEHAIDQMEVHIAKANNDGGTIGNVPP